jgi:nickel-type superoxide dismutase maturation protease
MPQWPFRLGALAALLLLASRSMRVEVAGDSMRPTLEPGDRLLVWRTRRAAPGTLVVVPDPRRRQRHLVKRVVRVLGDGSVEVRGDNTVASTDSRTFGRLPRAELRGRVLYRYHPPGREGRLASPRARGSVQAWPAPSTTMGSAAGTASAPAMKSSTMRNATASWNCVGGDFMK